jgi:hypothetical protein
MECLEMLERVFVLLLLQIDNVLKLMLYSFVPAVISFKHFSQLIIS